MSIRRDIEHVKRLFVSFVTLNRRIIIFECLSTSEQSSETHFQFVRYKRHEYQVKGGLRIFSQVLGELSDFYLSPRLVLLIVSLSKGLLGNPTNESTTYPLLFLSSLTTQKQHQEYLTTKDSIVMGQDPTLRASIIGRPIHASGPFFFSQSHHKRSIFSRQ